MKITNPLKRNTKTTTKSATKKKVTKTITVEKPVKKSLEARVKDDYQVGLNYLELAEKHDLSVEAVAEIVGA